ncbi:MAG: DUF1573 domain-containing protein [Bacteroidales bacterium]|jgi:hypothetical protein|nr:DUF1573 domain-containing protein [Bacteroidales bacterium]
MKRSLVFLVFLLFFAGLHAQPRLNFASTRHDYGTIKEEAGKQEAVFAFTNTGDSVLVLTRVQSSCGCTASDYTKSPVPPGGKGFVTAVFDPKGYNSRFAKSITVYSNAKPAVTVLIIEGTVTPREKSVEELYTFAVGPVRFQSNHLAFTTTKKNEKKIRVMPVINTSKEAATVEFEGLPAHLKLKVSPATLKPGEKGLIEGTYDANLNNDKWGNVNDLVRMKVNGQPMPNIYLYVSANLVEDFSSLSAQELASAPVFKLESNTVDFGKINQNASADVEFFFTNEGKSDLVIRHVKSGCGCTALMPTENIIKPGAKGSIKAKFNSGGYKGQIYKNIFVYTNDPKSSEVMLMIKGEVLVEGDKAK